MGLVTRLIATCACFLCFCDSCFYDHLPNDINSSDQSLNVLENLLWDCRTEEVAQVYTYFIHMLHLPVISIMIIGVRQLSYNERAMSDGRFGTICSKLFGRITYPSRYVYFRWSRVHLKYAYLEG